MSVAPIALEGRNLGREWGALAPPPQPLEETTPQVSGAQSWLCLCKTGWVGCLRH